MRRIVSMVIVLLAVSGCAWFGSPGPAKPGVNPHLWQAALNKTKFMPMQTIDPQGGVIVTDWANMDNLTNEYFKITVHILSKDLRTDALNVKVVKRVWYKEKWGNLDVDPRVAQELEKAILIEARNLANKGKN